MTVDKTFRSTPRDTVVVRQLRGTVGSVTPEASDETDMNVDDENVLFLKPARS